MSGLHVVVVAALTGALIVAGAAVWIARGMRSANEREIKKLSAQLAQARASNRVRTRMLAPKLGDFPPWYGRPPHDESKLFHSVTDHDEGRRR